jgi:hypothetical protein
MSSWTPITFFLGLRVPSLGLLPPIITVGVLFVLSVLCVRSDQYSARPAPLPGGHALTHQTFFVDPNLYSVAHMGGTHSCFKSTTDVYCHLLPVWSARLYSVHGGILPLRF